MQSAVEQRKKHRRERERCKCVRACMCICVCMCMRGGVVRSGCRAGSRACDVCPEETVLGGTRGKIQMERERERERQGREGGRGESTEAN